MTILTNTAPHLPMLLSKMRLLANGMQVRCRLANEYFEYNICFRTSLISLHCSWRTGDICYFYRFIRCLGLLCYFVVHLGNKIINVDGLIVNARKKYKLPHTLTPLQKGMTVLITSGNENVVAVLYTYTATPASAIIGSPIQSIQPSTSVLLAAWNKTFIGRSVSAKEVMAHIMWSSSSVPVDNRHFSANHFVILHPTANAATVEPTPAETVRQNRTKDVATR